MSSWPSLLLTPSYLGHPITLIAGSASSLLGSPTDHRLTSASSCLTGSCALAGSGQTPVGGPQAQARLKPHLSTRKKTKEEELNVSSQLLQPWSYTSASGFLNSVLMGHLNRQVFLQLRCDWVYQLWTLWPRTCDGWARPESELPPQEVWDLTSVDLCQRPGDNYNLRVTRTNCQHLHS